MNLENTPPKNEPIGTPLAVKILLHHYCSPEPFENAHSDGYKETIEKLVRLGAVVASTTAYETTALGKAWCQSICSTQLPRVAYVDGHGELIRQGPTWT